MEKEFKLQRTKANNMTDKYSVAIQNQILKPKINWNKKLSILMHEET